MGYVSNPLRKEWLNVCIRNKFAKKWERWYLALLVARRIQKDWILRLC